MSDVNLLISYPTRGRGFTPLYYMISHMDGEAIRAKKRSIHVVIDDDDQTNLAQLDRVRAELDWVNFTVIPSQGKVAAINATIDDYHFAWDVVFQASDDLVNWQQDFDTTMCNDMVKYFPDLNGCLWYDIDNQPEYFNVARGSKSHASMCINIAPVIGSKFFRECLGQKLYYPDYKSFFCDQELMAYVQQKWGPQYMRWIPNRLCEHGHPSWGQHKPDDETYQRANPHWQHDMAVWKRRKQELGLRDRHK